MWLGLLSSFFLNLSRAAALLSVKGFLVSLNCLIKGSRSFSCLLMSSFGEGGIGFQRISWCLCQALSSAATTRNKNMARSATALLKCTSSSSPFLGGELRQEVNHDWDQFIHSCHCSSRNSLPCFPVWCPHYCCFSPTEGMSLKL